MNSIKYLDFAKLINNVLSLAEGYFHESVRKYLSLEYQLANGMIRFTGVVTPIYGPRSTRWKKPELESEDIFQAVKAKPRKVPQRSALSRTTPESTQYEIRLLQEYQNLHQFLIVNKRIPPKQHFGLLVALSKNPVISIRKLAEATAISSATAQRWLNILQQAGFLRSFYHNGMNQYSHFAVIEILDTYLLHKASELRRKDDLRHHPGQELYSPFR